LPCAATSYLTYLTLNNLPSSNIASKVNIIYLLIHAHQYCFVNFELKLSLFDYN